MENWKDLLTFNRSERRGIWLLILLIIISNFTNFIIRRNRETVDPVRLSIIYEESTPGLMQRANDYSYRKKPMKNRSSGRDSLFFFDPNTITSGQWQMLGLSEKQAAVITKYTSGGGSFRKKEDLRKSFVISESFYAKVEPWIRIVPQSTTEKKPGVSGYHRNLICINQADTTEFKRLKGVGSVLASRIINYRNSLGGFHSEDQLAEVYGLSAEVVEWNSNVLSVDKENIRTIPVNGVSEKILASHPYITKKLAYVIVAMREDAPIISEQDLINRLPSGVSLPPHLLPYLRY